MIHEAAVAAVVGSLAVDELLLRERHEGAGLDRERPFDGAGAREGPARAASTLILDLRTSSAQRARIGG